MIQNLSSDLNVLYFGASGGFYLLHHILLYRKHFVYFGLQTRLEIQEKFAQTVSEDSLSRIRLSKNGYADCRDPGWPSYDDYVRDLSFFNNEQKQELEILHKKWGDNWHTVPGFVDSTVDYVIAKQWTQTGAAGKSTEIWPSNSSTLMVNPVDRQYKLYFHCNEIEDWLACAGKKIILYTDIQTQLRMAWCKKAFWFVVPDQNFVKQSKIQLRRAKNWNNVQVMPELVTGVFSKADQIIYLQDLLNQPEKVFGIPSNAEQLKLREKWISLHPPILLKKSKILLKI